MPGAEDNTIKFWSRNRPHHLIKDPDEEGADGEETKLITGAASLSSVVVTAEAPKPPPPPPRSASAQGGGISLELDEEASGRGGRGSVTPPPNSTSPLPVTPSPLPPQRGRRAPPFRRRFTAVSPSSHRLFHRHFASPVAASRRVQTRSSLPASHPSVRSHPPEPPLARSPPSLPWPFLPVLPLTPCLGPSFPPFP